MAITFNHNDKFYVNGSYVGIGTNDPTQILDVAGNIVIPQGNFISIRRSGVDNPILWQGNGTFGSTDQLYLRQPNNNNLHLQTNGGNTRLLITGAGNVGIGTTSPWTKLVLDGNPQSGTANNGVALAFDGGGYSEYGYRFKANGANYYQVLYDGSAINWKNYAGGASYTTRMSLTNDGKLGIGTTSPAAKLEVFGTGNTLRLDSAANGSKEILFRNVGTGTATIKTDGDLKLYVEDAGKNILFDTTGGEKMRIQADGNVGIGTTSPDAPLHVVPASDFKVLKLGDDLITHYKITGAVSHVLTLTCGSYYQAEVVITANQTNSGGYNNLYIRGIWSNNYTSHHWDVLEEVGYLTGSSFDIVNGQNDVSTSGKLEINHNYSSGSFAGMTVRVTDMYGTHSYTIA